MTNQLDDLENPAGGARLGNSLKRASAPRSWGFLRRKTDPFVDPDHEEVSEPPSSKSPILPPEVNDQTEEETKQNDHTEGDQEEAENEQPPTIKDRVRRGIQSQAAKAKRRVYGVFEEDVEIIKGKLEERRRRAEEARTQEEDDEETESGKGEETESTKDEEPNKPTRIVLGVRATKEEFNPRNLKSKPWSFLWATIASWLIGPQFFVALWDRIMSVFGQTQMMSGETAMGFGFMNGPARWFRDQVATHWETDSMGHMFACAAFGVIPLILVALANNWTQYARWLLGVATLGPAVYLIGVSYLGWVLTWTDLYLTGIFASAWYSMWWLAENKEPGLPRFLVMIPVTTVVTGFAFYSPGAVF